MQTTINVKTLRHEMGRIIERAKRGEHFTVHYRSRPAFRIVLLHGRVACPEDDALFGADPLHDASRLERIDASRAEKARDWFFESTAENFSFTDCTSDMGTAESGRH